jgi:hypothetical protein
MDQVRLTVLAVLAFGAVALATAGDVEAEPPADIKAYCLDFNWGGRGKLAKPGTWKDADPAQHVAWYKAIGANTIQTFCVSTNGYAWYKGGPVPEQPGLKHDFLREVVKLGHAEGLRVFGYFTIGSNPRWGEANPDHYYPGGRYNIAFTDKYMEYLTAAIGDAVKTTGIDGFMIDWVWMPQRKNKQNPEGKWKQPEKELYQQLMGEPFPGEDKLTAAQDTAFSRKAIDRCWQTIRKAAKDANPNVIIWLTSNSMKHPHVINSDMYRQVDWLMGETGNNKQIAETRTMVGEHTRLITCLAVWNGQDAAKVVPEALEAGIGLYGFCKPRNGAGLVPLDGIFARQVSELSGDDRNIAVLARAYHGKSAHALWRDGRFVEPEFPPPFDITFRRRGRGWQDTAKIDYDKNSATVSVRTPYQSGRCQWVRTADKWPEQVTIRLGRQKGRDSANVLRIANGSLGLATSLDGQGDVTFGKITGKLELGRPWGDQFAVEPAGAAPRPRITQSEEVTEITLPAALTADNPERLLFEWALKASDRVR